MAACRIDALAGCTTLCPEGACPFWEPGGAVLEGRCMFELVDLSSRPAVVSELRALRDRLSTADTSEDTSRIRHGFHRLLNESGEA